MPNSAYDVQKAYLAYFGRPADPVGLYVWQNSDAAAMQAGFAASAEYAALYAGMTVEQRVNQVYQNLLGRAAEPAGLAYWVNEFNAGRLNVGTLAQTIMNSALGTDAQTVQNRITYATQFTAELNTLDEIQEYRGNLVAGMARIAVATVGSQTSSLNTALSNLQTALSAVCAGTSPADAIAAAAAADAAAASAAAQFTLTESGHAVTLSGSTTDAFVYTINGAATRAGTPVAASSGSLTDSVTTFNASGYHGPTAITLAAGSDSVTGGAGADTLIAGGLTATGTFAGLAAADTITMTAGADIKGVNTGASTGAGTAAITGAVTMTAAQHQGFTTFAAAGGTDQITITTGGAITAANSIETYILSGAGNTLTVNAAKSGVNVTAGAGADTINVGGLTITGTYTGLAAADTLMMTNGADIRNLNGGATTGAGTANITGAVTMTSAQNDAFTTVVASGGADQITLTTSAMVSARTGIETYVLSAGGQLWLDPATPGVNIIGSAGADSIRIFGLTVTGTYSGIETILATTGANISGATLGAAATTLNLTDAITMSLAQYQAFSTITATGGADQITITTPGVTITGHSAIEGYVFSGTGNTFTYNAAKTAVSVTGGAGSDTVNVGALAVTGTLSGVEAIVATSGADIKSLTTDAAMTTLTMDGGLSLTASQYQGLSTINATGGADQMTIYGDLTGTATLNSAIETFVLRGSSDQSVTSASTQTISVFSFGSGQTLSLAGSGNDTVSIGICKLVSTSSGNITVSISGDGGSATTGSGNDTITVSNKMACSVAAGAGADTIDLSGTLNEYRITASTDGGAANANTGYDVLSNFRVSGGLEDTIRLSTALDNALGGGAGGAGIEKADVNSGALNTTGAGANAATDIFVLAGTTVAADADLTTLASIVSALGNVSMDANDEVMAVVNVAGNGGFGVYHIKATSAIAGAALNLGANADVSIVGVHTGDLTALFTTAKNISTTAF